jgi:hypothetical protein
MKRVIDTTETLGPVATPEGGLEVCAAADARYDEDSAQLQVKLNAFLRSTDLRAKEQQFVADWLPKPETVVESVGPDETAEVARDVFRRWVRKVREARPPVVHRRKKLPPESINAQSLPIPVKQRSLHSPRVERGMI